LSIEIRWRAGRRRKNSEEIRSLQSVYATFEGNEVAQMVTDVEKEMGPIDILINMQEQHQKEGDGI